MSHRLPLDKLVPNLAFAVAGDLAKIIEQQIPELKVDFPSFTNPLFSIGFDQQICIATITFRDAGIGIPTGGLMDAMQFTKLKAQVGDTRTYSEFLKSCQLAALIDWNALVVAVDVKNGEIAWNDVVVQMVAWANDKPLSRATATNLRRVKRAIPPPPQYALEQVLNAMWVLECSEALIQGSAFDVEGYGTVTNAHVVSGTSNLIAFRASAPTESYKVEIFKKNDTLDLAIINIVDRPAPNPLLTNKADIQPMSHVAVCGFPNFKKGDTGIMSPGIVTGFRMESSVRRLLTNAGIVAGMSGGPAIGVDNRVVGVCTTGADHIQTTKQTEDQSIVPIAPLDLLLSI